MTVLLKEAFDRVSKLPETLQDNIAKELLEEFEAETPWKKISQQVKNLVENGKIADAREVLSNIPPGTSTTLDNWKRALENPKAKLDKSTARQGESIKKDALWLQDNSDKYKGKWIALKNGILIGAHESRIELRRSLKQTDKLAGTMFFRVDN